MFIVIGVFVGFIASAVVTLAFLGVDVLMEMRRKPRKHNECGVLPCPACGAKDKYRFCLGWYYHLECNICGFNAFGHSSEECLKKWNKASRKVWKQ